jgi:DNA recombination protein RmuC
MEFVFLAGTVLAILFYFWRTREYERTIDLLRRQKFELEVKLEEEKKSAHEKIETLAKAEEAMKNSFKVLSSDVLHHSQSHFFSLARETFEKYSTGLELHMKEKEKALDSLVRPLRESLEKVDTKIGELEKSRAGAYAGIVEQMKTLSTTHEKLQSETQALARALATPQIRGQWGEIQLKRVVEMAGMCEYADFVTQEVVDGAGGTIRPDLIVRLPNERTIVVDAKVPLRAYLEAFETNDDTVRAEKFREHAAHLKRHLGLLADKAYSANVPGSSEFTVLFLPTDAIFSQAVQVDPSLIEYGITRKVLIATPTTLIALLRAVAYGWQEKTIQRHAEEIAELGKSVYERLGTLVEHLDRLKRSLDTSCDAYNKVAACFDSRVLPAARKFHEMGVASDKEAIGELEPIEKFTRSLQ